MSLFRLAGQLVRGSAVVQRALPPCIVDKVDHLSVALLVKQFEDGITVDEPATVPSRIVHHNYPLAYGKGLHVGGTLGVEVEHHG